MLRGKEVMKIKKRWLALISTLLIGSLTACGSSTPTANGTSTDSQSTTDSTSAASSQGVSEDYEALLADIIPEETVTLDVFDQLANYSGEQIGWFGQVILEKFNVKLNIINDPQAGVYQTRMEAGNLGDIVIWGDDKDDYIQAVEKGMLYDWNEDNLLEEYGPYMKENMAFAFEKNANLSGGTTYGFGHDVALDASERQDFFYTWDIRWDFYKELGYPEVKDLNDMVTLLENMKKICPTDDNGKNTYGVSLFNDWDGDMVMFVKSLVTAYYGYDEFGFGFYDSTEQKYYPALEKDGPYFEALKFYNTLYQKGLLDPDSQTQKYDGMTEDYQNGTAFLNIFNWMGSGLYNSDTHAAAGKAMYPLVPEEATPIAYGQNVYGGNRIWSIGAKTEYPELCMAIINWLSTPEGRLTSEYGPKDVMWYYDENGKTTFTELGRAARLDILTELSEGYSGTFQDGMNQLNNTTWGIDSENPDSNGDTYNYKKWDCFIAEAQSEIEADWREVTGCITPDEYVGKTNYRLSPGTTYSGSPKPDDLMVLWNQVAECIKTNSWKAIYASSDAEFDKIVDEMIAGANEYGYAECVAFQENEAVRRAACENEVK